MKYQKFTFYESFFEAIEEVPKKLQGECYRAIVRYALTGEEPTDIKGLAKIIFLQAKPQIDANHRRAENGAKGAEFGAQGAEFGKLGGRPKTPQKTPENPPKNPPKNPRNINNLNTNNANTNTNIEVVEEKNIIKKEQPPKSKFDFKGTLLALGVSEPIADEWISIRKKKKGINSELALKNVVDEANKAGISLHEAIEFAAKRQWVGFQADWYFNSQYSMKPTQGGGRGRGHTLEEMARIVDAGIALNDILGTRNEKERRGETWNSTGR